MIMNVDRTGPDGQVQHVRIDNQIAGEIMLMRNQLAWIDARIQEQDLYRISRGRQVESMRELIRAAHDQEESDQYVAHCAGILARDERILEAAIADLMRIEQGFLKFLLFLALRFLSSSSDNGL